MKQDRSAIGEHVARSLQEDIELYSALIVFWESSFLDESIREMLLEQYRLYDRILTGLLDDGERAGELVVPDKKTYAALMIAMMEGVIVRRVLRTPGGTEDNRTKIAGRPFKGLPAEQPLFSRLLLPD